MDVVGRRGFELAGFLFFCRPNRVELLDELVRIDLGFALCRKRIKGFVSNLLVIVNIPAEAIGIPNIFYDVGRESGTVCHDLSCANGACFARKISFVTAKLAHQSIPLIKDNKSTCCEHY
jgi:hypothetical protein